MKPLIDKQLFIIIASIVILGWGTEILLSDLLQHVVPLLNP